MNTQPKLIAFIDGSVYAQSVCDHAAWFANKSGATVEILHLLGRRDVSSAPANLSGSIGLGARTALLEELVELDAQKARLAQKRGRALLEDARASLVAAGVQEVTTRLRHGEMVETLQEVEQQADMIVIGKRGEAANFDRLHLGSNLERVVRSSHKPVLVAARAFKPINRFLIAFDGGASALKAVEHVAQSRVCAGLECHLLTVGKASAETLALLEQAARQLDAAGYKVEFRVVPGQAEEVISRQVEAENIDLLVMGAYGHSRIRNLIIGSTTTEMISRCKVPLILFR